MQNGLRYLALPAFAWSLLASAQIPVTDASNPYGGAASVPAGSMAAAPVSAQGQLFMQLEQMQQEIAQLRGLLEEQQNEIQRLKQEGLERYQELDRRLAGGASAPAVQQNVPATTSTGSPAVAPVAPQQPAAPGDPAKEKLYYDAAFDLIKARDFPKASQAFSAFLRKYPNSQYAGNAQYWLGEVDLAQGNLPGAAQAFALVGQVYPQHAKVPDSLYKLADVELRMGQTDKAKGILRQLVSQYPGSSAAQLAERELSRLP
jgi:tol-pal system protein YbgF